MKSKVNLQSIGACVNKVLSSLRQVDTYSLGNPNKWAIKRPQQDNIKNKNGKDAERLR